jgi:hypothetical protein
LTPAEVDETDAQREMARELEVDARKRDRLHREWCAIQNRANRQEARRAQRGARFTAAERRRLDVFKRELDGLGLGAVQ